MTGPSGRKVPGVRCAIAVMAKAPNAGRIKTRLAPMLDADAASELGCCFLTDICANLALAAREVALDPHIAFSPAGSEAAFAPLVGPGTRFVLADGSRPAPAGVAGIGRSLLQATQALLDAGYGAVGLLNADSPTLPTALLVEAARLVTGSRDRVVLGPAVDGGYYLIAMTAPHAELFTAIDWSTALVAEQTRERARALGLEVVELAPWYDVDDPASLRLLVAELGHQFPMGPLKPYRAPATRAWLERFMATQTADFFLTR